MAASIFGGDIAKLWVILIAKQLLIYYCLCNMCNVGRSFRKQCCNPNQAVVLWLYL